MNIVADFGNTSVKLGLVEDQKIKEVFRFDSGKIDLDTFFSVVTNAKPEIICYLGVSHIEENIIDFFHRISGKVICFNHSVKLPFKISYRPVESLGIDRLAGVVGARALFPESDFLVIQAGTCITYDLYFQRSGYSGGAISPGTGIRNKAMNTFTYQLPLVETDQKDDIEVIADHTKGSLLSGIYNGSLFEMQGFIDYAQQLSENMKVILSGGDMIFFVKKIKSQIFANSNLTLTGLIEIIKLNEEKH